MARTLIYHNKWGAPGGAAYSRQQRRNSRSGPGWQPRRSPYHHRLFWSLLDLDVSTGLAQNIKLAEAFPIDINDSLRAPRLRPSDIEEALAVRPELPKLQS